MIQIVDEFIRCECVDGLEYDSVIFRKNLSSMLMKYILHGIKSKAIIKSVFYKHSVYRVDYDNMDTKLSYSFCISNQEFWGDIYNYIDDFVRVRIRDEKINKILE